MKEQILKLRAEGKTYNEIKAILNCSKSTISFHCGEGQKDKSKKRTKKIRSKNKLFQRVEAFRTRKNSVERARKFQKRVEDLKIKYDKIETIFTWQQVIEKFGEKTICYLSGTEEINLLTSGEYQLDHIIPKSKGGDTSLENLGILHKDVNYMKGNLTKEELIVWCKKILEFNGYRIT